ncbi:MAG: vitamin B12-dependent ribonucleotide reductase, partial [Actinomycetota bacterium]
MSEATRTEGSLASAGSATAGAALEGNSELQINRSFTTPSVHPYDELEWESREAVIKNYRTGEVAFEQRDIEFPKSWSQNATNIVAQKYFRGAPNSPQRERSVK